jgi:hypothetical protein
MRRAVEVALVVLVLVAVPVAVGIIARSEPSPGPPQLSALGFMRPILAHTGFTPARCEWNSNRTEIHCVVRGGGSCAVDLRAHTGSCSSTDYQSGFSDSLMFSWAQKGR